MSRNNTTKAVGCQKSGACLVSWRSAFWYSLALEFVARGWTSRSLDFVANASWTRTAYCATPAFARYAVDEAERAGLLVTDFFGFEKQVTLRGPEPVGRVAEAIPR